MKNCPQNLNLCKIKLIENKLSLTNGLMIKIFDEKNKKIVFFNDYISPVSSL